MTAMTTTEASEKTPGLDIAALRERLRRHPYGTLAAAVGIGYVLGGGLFTRLTGRIVGPALRVGVTVALPYLQEELLGALAGNFTDHAAADAEAEAEEKLRNAASTDTSQSATVRKTKTA